MSNEKQMEIIKALAYGETSEQTAAAEGVSVEEILEIQRTCADEINEERQMLKGVGYIG